LPDSLKATALIDYRNQYRLRNADIPKIILMMGANGWKLTSTLYHPDSKTVDYILGRDILMDEATRKLYLKKIGDTFKSTH
jgi:hypothetical protein